MTTLTVDLSPTLSSTLAHSGVYAYAVYFNSVTGDDPQGVVLVNNGAVVSGGSVSFDLPTPFASGKVTFIIQSLESGTASDLFTISDNLITGGGTVTSQGQIDWGPAQQNDYRFDSFEVSLTPNAADTGDLTEINGFGILSGGIDDILGSGSNIVVSGSGLLEMFGLTTSITIASGGEEALHSGIDSAAQINTSGRQTISANALAISATVAGGFQLIFGSASGTLVSGAGGYRKACDAGQFRPGQLQPG